MLLVLWCNGSTRDFGSLRDCSSQSRTTAFFHRCTSACESSSALFIIDVFRRFLFIILISYFSTACDKSLSYALKAIR